MKRIVSILLICVFTFCFSLSALATSENVSLKYILDAKNSTVDASGNNTVTVKPGDVVTVTYFIENTSSGDDADTATTQNQIKYDHNFFQLVDKSIVLGDEAEYVFSTSCPVDSDANQTHYVFFNSVSSLSIYRNEKFEIGTFQLKVMAKSGSSTIVNTQYKATDNAAELFGAEKQDLVVIIEGSEQVPVTEINLNKSELTLNIPDSESLTPDILPSNATNREVVWSSSNPAVASVSDNGVVKANSVGTAKITVKTEDGNKTASCNVTVKNAESSKVVSAISLNKETTTLKVGSTETLTAAVTPDDAANKVVTWTSSNNAVAVVVANGVVTAKAEGTAVITATTADGGKTATCTVTVTKEESAVTPDTPDTPVIPDTPDTPVIPDTPDIPAIPGTPDSPAIPGTPDSPAIPGTPDTPGAPDTLSDNPFLDVQTGSYYYDAVLWAAENGVTQGTDAEHFSPDMSVNRAQVVTFLWRAAGCPEPTGSVGKFSDVEIGYYYDKAVAWAVEQGITKGTSDTSFSPDMVCTRGQIVTFLARFAGVHDEDTGYTHSFTDVGATDYYNNAVAWAKDNQVTEGTSATTFSPNQDCTRAQIVTFLYRWMVR